MYNTTFYLKYGSLTFISLFFLLVLVTGSSSSWSLTQYELGYLDGVQTCTNNDTNVHHTIIRRNIYYSTVFDFSDNVYSTTNNTTTVNYNITNTFVIRYDYRDLIDSIPYQDYKLSDEEITSLKHWLLRHVDAGQTNLENYYDNALDKMSDYTNQKITETLNALSSNMTLSFDNDALVDTLIDRFISNFPVLDTFEHEIKVITTLLILTFIATTAVLGMLTSFIFVKSKLFGDDSTVRTSPP